MFSVLELLQCNRRWEIVSIRNLAPNSGHLTEASLMFSGIISYSCALESSGARCAAFTVAGNANSTIDCHERWYFRSREVVRCASLRHQTTYLEMFGRSLLRQLSQSEKVICAFEDPLCWFHGPCLRRDNENDGLRPNLRLDALSQCASNCGHIMVRVTVIHGVRKSAFSRSSFDLPVPVVFLHRGMQILVILAAGSSTQLNANK